MPLPTSKEFHKLVRFFHGGLDYQEMPMETLVDAMLQSLKPSDVQALGIYFDDLLSGRYNKERLLQIWNESPAGLLMTDGDALLRLLRLIKSRIDAHPSLKFD